MKEENHIKKFYNGSKIFLYIRLKKFKHNQNFKKFVIKISFFIQIFHKKINYILYLRKFLNKENQRVIIFLSECYLITNY